MSAKLPMPFRSPIELLLRSLGPMAAVVALVLSVLTPSQAQEEELVPITPMLGLWQQANGDALEVGGAGLWWFEAGQEFRISEAACPVSFEYLGYLRSGADILFPYEANGSTDGQGQPLADQLRTMLADGPYLTLNTACCCVGDVNRGAQLIQTGESSLVGVFWQDGVYDLRTYGEGQP